MPSAVSGRWKWLPKAALNEQTDLSPVPPSQLKSNVISLDCHISQYATICQQLQAEVRSRLGSLAERQGTRLGGRTGPLARGQGALPAPCLLCSPGALRGWAASFQVATLREKLRVYEAGAQAPQQDSSRSPKAGPPHQP